MTASLEFLIDSYIKTAYKRQPPKRQEAAAVLTAYQDYLYEDSERKNFYEKLEESNLSLGITKYDSTISKGKEVNVIQDDLVQFLKTWRGDDKKRHHLQYILHFWTYLYDEKQIPINPVEETLKRGTKDIENLALRLIPESTALRQVELLKLIQDPIDPKSKEELSDLLFVNERTIENDFKAINEHQAFWQYSRFHTIRSWDCQTGVWEHDSNSPAEANYTYSLHPFFTVLPLDAIAGLLQGIETLRNENHPHLLAFDWLTDQLRAQLSPYARERLEALGFELAPADQPIERISEMAYNDETILRPLSHAFKAGEVLNIVWMEEGSMHTEKVKVKHYPVGKTVLLEREGQTFELPIEWITEVEALYPYRSRRKIVLRSGPASQGRK